LFIGNLSDIYDAGVRIATIPHTHWAKPIKVAYPDLYLKNTILRSVHRPAQVYELAKLGFDCINLDRNLMRDHELIRIIHLARLRAEQDFGRKISLSLLGNEGCRGYCPTMAEHYTFNCTRHSGNTPYMLDPISDQTCKKWSTEDLAYKLKVANMPPWKEDWDELLSLGIDVFKMHGRESMGHLYASMAIIDRFSAGEEIIVNGFREFLSDKNLEDAPINAWRKKIKSCQFECWSCKYCDNVIAAHKMRG
jgi:hypothetical protein